MLDQVRAASIVLLESNPLIQQRLARILAAGSGFASVTVVHDIVDVSDALTTEVSLLVVSAFELDLATEYAKQLKELKLVCLANEIHARSLTALMKCPSLSHIVGWPDFLTIPRSWDLTMAARMTLAPVPQCVWKDILPAASAHVNWELYSSFDRDTAVDRVSEIVRFELRSERAADTIGEVAYEMAMNAMYDAPVDDNGIPKYGHNRRQDIALEDHEVPSLKLATDGNLVVLQIEDPFGLLKRSDVLEGIRRGVAAKTAGDSKEVLNTNQGGAGLGIFRMFQLASALIFDVIEGKHTRVLAVFDLSLRVRDRRSFPTSLHLSFQ